MARDQRPSGRVYFYRYAGRRLTTKTTVRRYVGTGPVAAYLALYEADQRAARRSRVTAEQHDRQRILAATRRTREAINAAKYFMTIRLGALGFHQHSRGLWRKRRAEPVAENVVRQDGAIQTTQSHVDSQATTPVNDRASSCHPLALVNEAIVGWLKLLDWSKAIDVGPLFGPIFATCKGLLEDADSALEQVCVGRILVCRVQIQVIILHGLKGAGISQAQVKFLRRRRLAAERQLATAKAALATVRRLIQRTAGQCFADCELSQKAVLTPAWNGQDHLAAMLR